MISSKYIPFNYETKMKKKMIRKYSKMLNILYKCKVASMRNKGWVGY